MNLISNNPILKNVKNTILKPFNGFSNMSVASKVSNPTSIPNMSVAPNISPVTSTQPTPNISVAPQQTGDPNVRAQQIALNANGAGLKVDGILGPLTMAAIKNNESKVNKTPSGAVINPTTGGTTEVKSAVISTPPIAPEPTPTTSTPPTIPNPLETNVTNAENALKVAGLVSPDQNKTQAELDNLLSNTRLGVSNLEGQGRGIPLNLIRGQQAKLEKQGILLSEPLSAKLARLQAKRTAGIEAGKFALERADKKLAASKTASDGFTLGKGQSRFDAFGNVIAQNNPTGTSISTDFAGLPPEFTTAVQSGKTGNDITNSLNPSDAATLKAILEYKKDPKNLSLRKSASDAKSEREKFLSMAHLIDPTYDESQFPNRAAVRKDFTSGKTANNMRSLNTAVGHLKSLSDAFKKLNNSGVPIWNKIRNFGIQSTGGGEVTAVKNNINAVAGEMATVFKGSAGTDAEINAWKNEMNASQSPEQVKAGIDKMIELMGSRLNAFTSQWENGIGKPKDFSILSTKSRGILESLGIDVNAIDPVSSGNNNSGTSSSSGNIFDF